MPEAGRVQAVIIAAQSPRGPLNRQKEPRLQLCCVSGTAQEFPSRAASAFSGGCWGCSESCLCWVMDDQGETSCSSGGVCGEEGAGRNGLSLRLDPLIPLLALQARKTQLCSQLCKPWSLEGVSPALSGCVFGGWRCFAQCNNDVF